MPARSCEVCERSRQACDWPGGFPVLACSLSSAVEIEPRRQQAFAGQDGFQACQHAIHEILHRGQTEQIHRHQQTVAVCQCMFDEARLPHAPVAQQHEALPVVDCLTDTALQLRPGAKGRTGAKHLSEDERIGRLRFHARNAREVLHS